MIVGLDKDNDWLGLIIIAGLSGAHKLLSLVMIKCFGLS